MHEVAAEMLSFYEHSAVPITAELAQQHLVQLGLPATPAEPPPAGNVQALPPAQQQQQQRTVH